MNKNEKFLVCTLAIGVIILLLGVVSIANATPSGAYGQPFYTKTQQGKSIDYGRVECDTDGAQFLADDSSRRASLIMRNAGASTVYVCPTGAVTCVAGSDAFVAGFYLKTDDSLIVDRANGGTGTTGWSCFTISGSSYLHYLAEY